MSFLTHAIDKKCVLCLITFVSCEDFSDHFRDRHIAEDPQYRIRRHLQLPALLLNSDDDTHDCLLCPRLFPGPRGNLLALHILTSHSVCLLYHQRSSGVFRYALTQNGGGMMEQQM